jgi:S-DNA-T family DNA segregation ATPase FtsK/SpoIIIE
VSENQYELLKWYFVEVNDDTGFDAAADVIARAVANLAPGTPAGGAVREQAEPAERDLLDDLTQVLDDDRVRVADVPSLLRKLAPDWRPYRDLTGTQLRDQLAELGVRVTNTGNVPRLDPKDVWSALSAELGE